MKKTILFLLVALLNFATMSAQEVKKTMTVSGIDDVGLFIDPTVKPDWDTTDPVENDKPHYLSLRYEEFIAPMVQTIQYLEKRISALEGK